MRRKRRIKKRKVSKSVLILAVVAGIVIIISVALYLNQPRARRTAEEYFEILDATIDYGEFRQNETAVIIYTISFKIRAVGGDAHDVMVQSWAKADRYYVGEILKGETGAVMEMSSSPPFGILSEKDEDGKFPMDIRITSMEAEGSVTIYF